MIQECYSSDGANFIATLVNIYHDKPGQSVLLYMWPTEL